MAVLVVISVGLAFADASVVALALPDLYSEFETTIVAVSWVLTIYALAVAAAGLIGLGVIRRVDPSHLCAGGAFVFAVASVVAGIAPSLALLLAARAVQGVGAAALVMGALSVLRALLGDRSRAGVWWATAGSLGAVFGPALGGLVTQVLDWRAVFLVQAPVALGAIAVAGVATERETSTSRRPRGAVTADGALALVFGALVGALFLAVILLVVVWGYEPIAGALVVTALPVGSVSTRLLRPHLSLRDGGIIGGLCLAGGLATLAFVPGIRPGWAAAALTLCGVGYGAALEVLGPLAVPPDGGTRAATLSSTARHLGLVVGLALIAPVLSNDVNTAVDEAPLPATASVLDAPIKTATKVRIALDIASLLEEANKGEIPEVESIFARHADGDDGVFTLHDEVNTDVREVITGAFRNAFGVAAILGLAAGMAAFVAIGQSSASNRVTPLLVGAAACLSVALPVAAYAAGGRDAGEFELIEPCDASPNPVEWSGFDAMLQRSVLSGLNGAACELGVGREEMVLSIDPSSGFHVVDWDGDTIEDALRAGVGRAIDDADERNTLPGWAATALHWVVDRAPVSWFLDRLGVD